MNDQEFISLKKSIKQCANLDLDGYKVQQIRRRLDGYVRRFTESVPEYCHMLEKDRALCRELIDYLAINVSEFFRDPVYFGYLKTEVLPPMLKDHPRLNIWSAACSCGQEPYSLAILLEEMKVPYRIVATDIDQSALETARKGGPYSTQDVRNVEKRLQATYMETRQDGFWIKDSLTRKVQFKIHNLQSSAFERGFDLILCRNAIIYFSDQVRDAIFREFRNSLKEGGILFIGGSEAILHANTLGYKVLRPPFYAKYGQPVPVTAAAASR